MKWNLGGLCWCGKRHELLVSALRNLNLSVKNSRYRVPLMQLHRIFNTTKPEVGLPSCNIKNTELLKEPFSKRCLSLLSIWRLIEAWMSGCLRRETMNQLSKTWKGQNLNLITINKSRHTVASMRSMSTPIRSNLFWHSWLLESQESGLPSPWNSRP